MFEQYYVKSNHTYSLTTSFTSWIREDQDQKEYGPYKLILKIYVNGYLVLISERKVKSNIASNCKVKNLAHSLHCNTLQTDSKT